MEIDIGRITTCKISSVICVVLSSRSSMCHSHSHKQIVECRCATRLLGEFGLLEGLLKLSPQSLVFLLVIYKVGLIERAFLGSADLSVDEFGQMRQLERL